MTREEMDGLWELLKIFRPNDIRLQDKKLKSAWFLVLEPYQREDVRQAVAEWFRQSKFLPDVSEIAMLCRGQPGEEPAGSGEKDDPLLGGDAYREWFSSMEEALEMGRLMDEDYQGAGIPHPDEARRAGWSVADWNMACREALRRKGRADVQSF